LAVELKILVGTMTGTSELVAREVQQALESAGYGASLKLMDGLDGHVFEFGGAFLICTSTYGNGDVPDNAQAFYASLQEERPDLSNVTYGVIALGDSTYQDTYCHGGIRFDKILTELGAKRLGEIFFHDANSGTLPEEVAAKWIVPWAEKWLAPESGKLA
jgi:MioC protein